MKKRITLLINGDTVEMDVDPATTLAQFLRERLHLTGTKIGCGNGECGACTVILDGEPVRSCLILAVEADAASVVTIEGLGADNHIDLVQQAFIDEDAIQCGFCSPGFILAVYALLRRHPQPNETRIKEALSGHLCRCTGYDAIYRAVRRAARLLADNGDQRQLDRIEEER